MTSGGMPPPEHVYGLTLDVEKLLPRAYTPFLTQRVRVVTDALRETQVDDLVDTRVNRTDGFDPQRP